MSSFQETLVIFWVNLLESPLFAFLGASTMNELSTGFSYLHQQQYEQAYHYFHRKAVEYSAKPKMLDICLFGQARALNGLGQVEFAKAVLFAIINGGSTWEKPFIMLARIYETEGAALKAAGNDEEAIALFQKAQNVFLLAYEKADYTQTLDDTFAYFLDELLPQAKPFTPAFNHDVEQEISLALLPSFLHHEVAQRRFRRSN